MDEKIVSTLPGTRDLLPEEMARWHLVEDAARNIFTQYGFQEIRTPIFEATELFARSIGSETDIVGKEMYTFTDQSGKSVSLRPENTASVVRAYVQHSMSRAGRLARLYYVGPMFRHEKKQKGRWRQFSQIGAEVLGSDHPAIEAEAIEMILRLLSLFRIESRLLINSVGCGRCRPDYIRRLRESIGTHADGLCADCRRRAESNALRVLDCKVETCQPLIAGLPRITEHLCADCSSHFQRLREYLGHAKIAYEIVPRLVRGLDYYVRTAFEIVSSGLGAQNALVGGGRYDGLSEALGGPQVHGFGFAMGLDRLVMILPQDLCAQTGYRPDVYLAYLGGDAFRRALELGRSIRSSGRNCHLEFEGGSLKSQLRLAHRLGARHVVIIGDEELARDTYLIRRMRDSVQWEASLPELMHYLSAQAQDPSSTSR